ncbi:MAG: hypothetical protein ACREOQ_04145 [Gemmatimonadales bacterium]
MPDDVQSENTGFRMVRLRPGLEAQHPSLGSLWYRVLDRNDAALRPTSPPGQLWVEVGPRVRLLPANIFELERDLVS